MFKCNTVFILKTVFDFVSTSTVYIKITFSFLIMLQPLQEEEKKKNTSATSKKKKKKKDERVINHGDIKLMFQNAHARPKKGKAGVLNKDDNLLDDILGQVDDDEEVIAPLPSSSFMSNSFMKKAPRTPTSLPRPKKKSLSNYEYVSRPKSNAFADPEPVVEPSDEHNEDSNALMIDEEAVQPAPKKMKMEVKEEKEEDERG